MIPSSQFSKIYHLILLLTLLVSVEGWAQDRIAVNPGSDQMDASFIEPYTNKWQVSVIDTAGTRNVVRFWTDYLQILKLNGKKYLHRVQDLYSADYDWQQSWINIVEASTLIPLRYTLQGATGQQTVMQFMDGQLLYKSQKREALTDTTINLERQVYDWNLYGMLLVALPFEIGTTYSLPYWSEQTHQIDYVTATIEETVTLQSLSGRSYETYKIRTNERLTFWLTKTKPYVIKLQLDMPSGSTMIWEMM